MSATEKEFWTIPEATEYLGVSRSTIWRWTRQGRIHFTRVAGRKVIPLADVAAMAILHPLRKDKVLSCGVWRYAPVPSDWFESLTPEEVRRTQAAIAAVLRHGGAPVNPAGLAPIICSDEMPSPIFWRYLLRGLEDLLTPRKSWSLSDDECREAKERAAREGIGFWEAL